MLFWTGRNCDVEGTHPPQHLPRRDSRPPSSHETQRRSATSQETGIKFYNVCSYFIFILLLTTTVVQNNTLKRAHTLLIICHQCKMEGSTTTPLSHHTCSLPPCWGLNPQFFVTSTDHPHCRTTMATEGQVYKVHFHYFHYIMFFTTCQCLLLSHARFNSGSLAWMSCFFMFFTTCCLVLLSVLKYTHLWSAWKMLSVLKISLGLLTSSA